MPFWNIEIGGLVDGTHLIIGLATAIESDTATEALEKAIAKMCASGGHENKWWEQFEPVAAVYKIERFTTRDQANQFPDRPEVYKLVERSTGKEVR